MQSLLTFDSDALTIRPWTDEIVDQLGFDPRSPYVERFWLGVLGPSTTWLMRRFASGFDAAPEGFDLPLSETARALGLGDRGGRNSPFLRSLNRSIQFEMARVIGPSTLAVRRSLPPLSRRHLVRLDPILQAEHQRFQEQLYAAPEADAAARERRGRQLALSLLELGEDREEAERQLLRWRYAPALARDAAMWAWRRHCAALQAAQTATQTVAQTAAQTAARSTSDTVAGDESADHKTADDKTADDNSAGYTAPSRTAPSVAATGDSTTGDSTTDDTGTINTAAVSLGARSDTPDEGLPDKAPTQAPELARRTA